jgi:hypothetical protein
MCAQQLVVPREVYEETSKDATLFLLVRGHESGDVETVIIREAEYLVVRKDPGLPQTHRPRNRPLRRHFGTRLRPIIDSNT